MILMTKNGACMHAYNPKEVIRLEGKGWTVVPEVVPEPAPVKKARKSRAKK